MTFTTAPTGAKCPTCGGYVGLRDDGTLFPHSRTEPLGQVNPASSMVPCESGGKKP